MITTGVSTFLTSWRGFLVGTRRGWHAHHRSNLEGHRGGNLIGFLPEQVIQIKRAASLMVEIFARGGQIWGFSLGSSVRRGYPWGTHYSGWRPGILSNYFFCRLRRTHFTQRLRQVLSRPRRVYRRRRTRLSRRWGRLLRRGGLPRRVYSTGSQLKRMFLAGFSSVVGSLVGSTFHPSGVATFRSQPHCSYGRTRWLRQWWNSVSSLRGGSNGFFGWGRQGIRGVQKVRLVETFNRAGRRIIQVRQTRRVNPPGRNQWVPGLTNPVVPYQQTFQLGTLNNHPVVGTRFGRARQKWTPRGVHRYQRWPSPFPTLLVGGGFTLLGATLFNEAVAAGIPLVYWGGTSGSPHRGGFLSVLWNQSCRSLEGVRFLLGDLFFLAGRTSLLRTLWGRLGV